jgi:hypothetical protein
MIAPPLKQVPSPNASSRAGARIRLVVVHMMEGSYAGSIAWLCMVKAQVSAHLCMKADGSEWTQLVPLSGKAWHACNANPYSIGVEAEGFTAKGFDDAWAKGLAWGVAWLLKRYGLPCRWAEGGAGEGFCSHHDLGAMGGGHFDICEVGSPDWRRFAGFVDQAFAAFGDDPPPDWALHGLPAPTAIAPPPAVAPSPSHGGAARSEPGDVAGGAAVGSTLWLQRKLVTLGVSATLDCDGLNGPQTSAAVARFQGAHGLFVDGVAGPKTIAALEAATG